MNYYYSPHTGEQIVTDDPADWMGGTTVAPPVHNQAVESCFFDSGAWVIRWPAEPLLDELKTAKNAEINAARLTANRGTFTHAGKTFACDDLSRGDIETTNGEIGNQGVIPVGWPGGWKAIDNTYIAIADVVAWKDFYSSMFSAGNANFAISQDLKARLVAATTADGVAAIAWPAPAPVV